MDEVIELVDLGDAKEETKGLFTNVREEELPGIPYRQED